MDYTKTPLAKPHRCDICQRRRKVFNRSDHSRWDYFCAECVDLEGKALRQAVEEAAERAANKVRPKKAYPIIGGPLDGYHATTDDFYRGYGKEGDKYFSPEGMYSHLRDEYAEYNCAGRHSKNPSMIFVHASCLKPVISGRDR